MKQTLKETLVLLKSIQKTPNSSQRKMAKELGYSIGKLNYCLKKLQNKGLIKIKNFKQNPNKLKYAYLLTPKGIAEKTKLTINYMKVVSKEYDELRQDLK